MIIPLSCAFYQNSSYQYKFNEINVTTVDEPNKKINNKGHRAEGRSYRCKPVPSCRPIAPYTPTFACLNRVSILLIYFIALKVNSKGLPYIDYVMFLEIFYTWLLPH